ncbi:hypothetical protein BV372_30600 [Nostoc sp. T09]|uniref:hypothetical protein n=1 Tax=Nostoc sp. T09 TaxID=1932621 RepID=UPI000B646D28|nr:hypothetical protein [Nostoc sp. T09]OUL22336.1 hypothetical protein BV372_30600 [Nostoc sp. T09]
MNKQASSRSKSKTSQNLDNCIDATVWEKSLTTLMSIAHFWGRDWRLTAPKPTNGRLQDLGSIPNGSTCFDFD